MRLGVGFHYGAAWNLTHMPQQWLDFRDKEFIIYGQYPKYVHQNNNVHSISKHILHICKVRHRMKWETVGDEAMGSNWQNLENIR